MHDTEATMMTSRRSKRARRAVAQLVDSSLIALSFRYMCPSARCTPPAGSSRNMNKILDRVREKLARNSS